MSQERPSSQSARDDLDGPVADRPAARLAELGLELPERGTGARAARRAAKARRTPAAEDLGEPDAWKEALDAHEGDHHERPRSRAAAGAPDPPSAPPEPGPRRLSRRWMAGFASALAVCLLAAAGLAWLGVSTLRDSRAGRTVTSAAPHEPGFEGFLEPTPTLAVTVIHEGLLDAVYVLSLGTGDVGGGVLLVPARTRLGDGGTMTLDFTYSFGADDEGLRGSIESVVGFGLDELVTVDEVRWAELVAPVAPLVVDNPDALEGFPVGRIELGPEQIGPFLAARSGEGGAMPRLVRHELVWEAWLAQVAGGGEVPGELDAGLGRFVRGLAAGTHTVRTLPATELVREDGERDYLVDDDGRATIIASMVPSPRGTASAPRTLVRLLDGTGDQDHVPRLAPRVVASGSSIVVVGNADHFGYAATEVRYHRPDQQRAAERLVRDLGAGQVIEDVRPIDTFDVTIVLGDDL